jgi:hypothetical protein
MSAQFHLHRPIPKALILLLVAALALGACSSAAAPTQSAYDESKAVGGAPVMSPPEAAREAEMPAAAPGMDASTTNSQTAQQRIVIKNGSMSVVVTDPGATMAMISSMAEEMNGFVVSANLYKEVASNGAEVPRASVTIRVPAERMTEAIDRIKSQSPQDPLNENITSQDVTSDYVDLQSRLKNLEATEVELTRIMQEATRTEDVMAVYSQLVSIREQIEVIKGQIKYYDEAAALSSIAVELIADAAVQPIAIGGWQPQGVAKDAIESLVSTMQGLGSALIWIVIYLLPVLLVLGLIFVLPPALILRAILRRRALRKVIAGPPAPAE